MDPSVHRFSICTYLFYQTVLPSSTMVVENLAREPSCRKMSFLFFKRGPGGELKLVITTMAARLTTYTTHLKFLILHITYTIANTKLKR